MKDKFLQWHPAFYADIQIDFTEEKEKLIFENEHQLGTKPKSIDVLIIKKSKEAKIHKNIGKIFREHNIIEYKSPGDYLGVDDFYKVYGYACFYKANGEKENSIDAREITITFVTSVRPDNVLCHLQAERGYRIERQDGIYYVYGDWFSIQIIVTKELSKRENFWLRYLTDDICTPEEAIEIMNEYESHQQDKLYRSVMSVIVNANKEIFKEVSEMRDIVRILYKEELDEAYETARAETRVQERLQLLQEFVDDGIITMEQAAQRFGVAVTRLEELFAELKKEY